MQTLDTVECTSYLRPLVGQGKVPQIIDLRQMWWYRSVAEWRRFSSTRALSSRGWVTFQLPPCLTFLFKAKSHPNCSQRNRKGASDKLNWRLPEAFFDAAGVWLAICPVCLRYTAPHTRLPLFKLFCTKLPRLRIHKLSINCRLYVVFDIFICTAGSFQVIYGNCAISRPNFIFIPTNLPGRTL